MMTFSLSTISLALLIMGGLIILLIGIIADLYLKLRRFTAGNDGKSLESTIHDLHQKYDSMTHTHQEIISHHTLLDKKMSTAIRGAHMIRFKPFKDSGGNQSFACALINESGNGMVLSTLFARDRMSIFGKPVENFSSSQSLTQEEEHVLIEARNQMK